MALAEDYDSPEDLTEDLVEETMEDIDTQDQVYRLVFELWRRLETDKPCLSIFCDELDHQIHLYEHGHTESAEELQDVIANLQVILDENTDQGADPIDVLQSINEGCAKDIESFLFDFISEQIENNNASYAMELLDSFSDYIEDLKWFELLRLRVMITSDPEGATLLIEQLIDEAITEYDLEYNLALLSEMIHEGEETSFFKLVKTSLPLLETEEDLRDILLICADLFNCLDQDQEEARIQHLIEARTQAITAPLLENDTAINEFKSIVHHYAPADH